MKFGIMFANVGPLGTPDVLSHFARTAEEVGIESLWTVEHVAVPVGYQSAYPYSPDGKMPGPDNAPIPDPLVFLAYAAAVTTRIRLATGILILPQRNPIYVAKEVATLDVLSKGRVILGIGVGWLAEEFQALGIRFDERAARTSESVRALRSLWSPNASSFNGKFFSWTALESNPKPVQQPSIPIVVGGHTPMSARRAARYGDGFFPAVASIDKLPPLLQIMREECQKVGRKPESIEITAGAAFPDVDTVKRFEDLGVARITIGPPGFDPDSLTQNLKAFADNVIAKI
jgi:probable F420-dependent oxidoreductase